MKFRTLLLSLFAILLVSQCGLAEGATKLKLVYGSMVGGEYLPCG